MTMWNLQPEIRTGLYTCYDYDAEREAVLLPLRTGTLPTAERRQKKILKIIDPTTHDEIRVVAPKQSLEKCNNDNSAPSADCTAHSEVSDDTLNVTELLNELGVGGYQRYDVSVDESEEYFSNTGAGYDYPPSQGYAVLSNITNHTLNPRMVRHAEFGESNSPWKKLCVSDLEEYLGRKQG